MQTSRKPEPKVVAGGVGGALSIVLVWTLAQLGVEMPAEVGAALTTVIAFACGYLKAGAA